MKPQISVTQQKVLSGHRGAIFGLSLDGQERFLYSGADDGIVARWDLERDEDAGKAIFRTDNAVYALGMADDLGLLLIGTRDGTLHIANLNATADLFSLRKFSKSIYGLHYDKANKRVWVLYAEGFLMLFDLDKMQEINTFRLSEQHLRCILERNGQMLIGASDGKVYVLDKAHAEVLDIKQLHESSVFALWTGGKGDYLLSGGRDALLKLWDIKGGYLPLLQIPAHNFTVNAIVSLADPSLIATASRDKTLKIWDKNSLTLLKVIDFARNQGHLHSVNRLIPLSSESRLISCSDDKRIIVWEIARENGL